MSGSARCPACKKSVPTGSFQCPYCELLLVELGEELDLRPGKGSVVQALFERPRAAASRPRTTRGPSRQSPASAALPPEAAFPRVLAGLHLSAMSLSRIEASVVGLCDGGLSVREIARAARLSLPELQRILQGLISIGVVALPAPPPLPDTGEEEVDESLLQGAEDGDDALPTVKFDLTEIHGRLERHRASVEFQRTQARPPTRPPAPPPAPPARRSSAVQPRTRTRGGAGGQNPLEQAIKLERSGRGLEALRYLELAISRSDDAAPLYNRLAIVLIRERFDFRGAERMLLKALELDPSHPVYKSNLLMVRQRKPIATNPMRTLKPRG